MAAPTFATFATVTTPWLNQWNKDAYLQTEAFSLSPWDVATSSTSGAPVVVWEEGFVGLTRDVNAVFSWRPGQLEVDAPEEALFVHQGPVTDTVWQAYHQQLGLPTPSAPYGYRPEYGTWVDQIGRASTPTGDAGSAMLSLKLIDEQLEFIASANWPRGRYTVDEGWSPRPGPGGFGDWTPHEKMGDMAKLAARIRTAGHVPGLWLAPHLIHPASQAAERHPELLGPPVDMEGECSWNQFHYLSVSPASARHIRDLFQTAYDWGYRKLKLDIFYGRKREMTALTRFCREAAAAISPEIELEGHIPDPFASRYLDVVRLNDVLIGTDHPDWRRIAQAHYEVCRRSSPRHVLNLDHVGGNLPTLPETAFIEHARMLHQQLPHGYPVVSLFPQRLGPAAVEAVTTLLEANAHRLSYQPNAS